MHTVVFYLISSSCLFLRLYHYGLEQKDHWITRGGGKGGIILHALVGGGGGGLHTVSLLLFCELTSLLAVFHTHTHTHTHTRKARHHPLFP